MNVWLVLIGMGIVTFGLRLAFILLVGRGEIPDWLRGLLRFVPPAVLSALVALGVFIQGNGQMSFSPVENVRILAALIAGLVAWRTRKVLLTIVSGMVALWVLQAIL